MLLDDDGDGSQSDDGTTLLLTANTSRLLSLVDLGSRGLMMRVAVFGKVFGASTLNLSHTRSWPPRGCGQSITFVDRGKTETNKRDTGYTVSCWLQSRLKWSQKMAVARHSRETVQIQRTGKDEWLGHIRTFSTPQIFSCGVPYAIKLFRQRTKNCVTGKLKRQTNCSFL